MSKKLDYSGYSFSFKNAGGDFSGTVKVEEYKTDDGTPNELILTCGQSKYNLSHDVASLTSEKHEETKQSTSVGKSVGKLALAGMAGNAVGKRSYGLAGMLASGSTSIDTNKTVTETWHNVLIQFKDKKILTLNKVSAKEWGKFDDAYKVFTYEEFHSNIEEILASLEKESDRLRDAIGSLSGKEKEKAFQEIESIKKLSISLPKRRENIRKIALKKRLVKNLTQEEQAAINAELQKKAEQEKIEKEILALNLSKMSDYEFACANGYLEMSKVASTFTVIFLTWLTMGVYIIFHLMKINKNKKLWKSIEQSEKALKEFAEFREKTTKGLT